MTMAEATMAMAMTMQQHNQFLIRSLQINNEGVQHLMDCDNDAALRCFSTSLSNIRQLLIRILREEEQQQQQQRHTESIAIGADGALPSSSIDNSAAATVPHPNLVQLSPSPISGLNGDNEQFFAFQHGLNFPSSLLLLLLSDGTSTSTTSTITSTSTAVNGHSNYLHLYSASVMLNIALVYHRRGKMGSCSNSNSNSISNSNSNFLRAEAIYQKAIQCCAEAGSYGMGTFDNSRGQNAPISSVTLLIHVAVINNLARLHQDMDRAFPINKSMEFLERVLDSQRMRLLPLLDDNTLQELYLNILLSGRIQEYDLASPAA